MGSFEATATSVVLKVVQGGYGWPYQEPQLKHNVTNSVKDYSKGLRYLKVWNLLSYTHVKVRTN